MQREDAEWRRVGAASAPGRSRHHVLFHIQRHRHRVVQREHTQRRKAAGGEPRQNPSGKTQRRRKPMPLDDGKGREGRKGTESCRRKPVHHPSEQQSLSRDRQQRPGCNCHHPGRRRHLLLLLVGCMVGRWQVLCHCDDKARAQALRHLHDVIAPKPGATHLFTTGIRQARRLAQLSHTGGSGCTGAENHFPQIDAAVCKPI